MIRITFISLCFLLGCYAVDAQTSDTLKFTALNRTKLESFLDDTFVFAGINYSGMYYSNNFRELSYLPGMIFGIEQYLPFGRKSIVNTGFNVEQRNFMYRPENEAIRIKSWFVNIPVVSSFELPAFRQYDFRILLGAQASVRLNSHVSGNYPALLTAKPETFQYHTNAFHRFDFGWMFGFSVEHRDVLVRLRAYSGFIKFDRKDQGMFNSFSFETGYFLFRNIKR